MPNPPISADDLVVDHFRITPIQKIALKRLGISTLRDLLYHFPVRYGDTAEARSIDSLDKGDVAVIFGKITSLKASKGFKTKITMADGYVEDETGRIHCVWFNQPYLAKMTPEGALVRIEGKVSQRQKNKAGATGLGELYLSNPKLEVVTKIPTGVGDSLFGSGDSDTHTLYPVYPESRGVTSLWIYHALQKIFKSGVLDTFVDPIPEHILTKYNLPILKTALIWIHTPLKRDDAIAARKRLSFEEIFTIQLGRQQARKMYEKHPTFLIEPPMEHVQEFVRRFPFKATSAQENAINKILDDMKGERPMSRLLEGDVGSGKTAVAAATAYAVITSRPSSVNKDGDMVRQSYGRLQVAYMCPTEILASQHFESFISYFSYMPIRIGFITGSGCRIFPSKVNPKGWTDISRAQLLKWVAAGEIHVLVGTHALIQQSVQFKHLAYVIIDEQHRFGTKQRAALIRKNTETHQEVHKSDNNPGSKGLAPHLLSMTATPIPRTLSLTLYGDLDLTLLDELPAGRKPIITEIVTSKKLSDGADEREVTYEKVRKELASGRQVFVICPRIDEPDPTKEAALIAKSVKEEAKRLKKSIFTEYNIGVLHSRMNPIDKDKVMMDFKDKKIQILCATSVVEVGVNIPNATVILIEGAERFGLAQLHQLRGRVIRSNHQAYCYVFTETTSEKSLSRLRALVTAKNGFELAELDLAQRGAGELSGLRQWGISDVAMEALQNIKMVEAARNEAIELISQDETLAKYPDLKSEVGAHSRDVHFE